MGKDKKEKKKEKEQDGVVSMDVTEIPQESSPKKEKKIKKEKDDDDVLIKIEELSPLAKPLAQKKLLKKVHKVIKKASKSRQVKRGVKEVVKAIRKGEKGLLILAADISPIDIISHLPVLAEEANIPYVFVPSKEGLGQASSTKRPTSCVMVCPDSKKRKKKEGEEAEDYRELYDECFKEVAKLDQQIVI